ncbi:MAG TPA: hypothetical protein VF867_11345, partial [Arthrobacter sp.]
GILLALMALTGLASTAATGLKLNLPAMAGLLGAGQLVLHEAFTAFSGPAPGGSAPGPAGAPGHHLAAVPLPASVDSHLTAPGLDPQLSLLMLAGHTLATLLCALLLARGEEALWSLAAWLRPLLRLPVPVTPDAVVAPSATSGRTGSAPLPWRNLRRDCRRGPPAAVVFS